MVGSCVGGLVNGDADKIGDHASEAWISDGIKNSGVEVSKNINLGGVAR